MRGAIDLANSERGVICIVGILAAMVLVILGKLDATAWVTFTQWLVITLVASKTVTGVIETMRGPQPVQVVEMPSARVVETKPPA